MFITYPFITGEIVSIEVDEPLGDAIHKIEQQQYNKDRAETRRHCSFTLLEDALTGSESCDDALARKEANEALRNAICQLTPSQQTLLFSIYWDGETQASIAAKRGVSAAAISQQLSRIYKKMRKILK